MLTTELTGDIKLLEHDNAILTCDCEFAFLHAYHGTRVITDRLPFRKRNRRLIGVIDGPLIQSFSVRISLRARVKTKSVSVPVKCFHSKKSHTQSVTSNSRALLGIVQKKRMPRVISVVLQCNAGHNVLNELIKKLTYQARCKQLRWPSGKSVRLSSCRLGFDSYPSQTNDFKIIIHSFTA